MMTLFGLSWRFALISTIAFGGPSAVLPETHRLFVEDGHWLTNAQFTMLLTISQISPGLNTMYSALFGGQIAGPAGVAVATAGMYGPSSLLSWLMVRFTGRHRNAAWMVAVRRALAPITIALLMASGYLVTRAADRDLRALALTLLIVVLGLRTRVHPLWLLGMGAALGAVGVI